MPPHTPPHTTHTPHHTHTHTHTHTPHTHTHTHSPTPTPDHTHYRRTLMRPDAVARIMRATSKRNGGIIPKRSFAARAQRAAARNCRLTK